MTTENEPDVSDTIANDVLDYIIENKNVCATGSVNLWHWLNYDGEFKVAKYGGKSRSRDYVTGETISREKALRWMKHNPVEIIPTEDAKSWKQSSTTVWDNAEQQGVFNDVERCGWCGQDETNVTIDSYDTVDDGEMDLCTDCHQTWDECNEIKTEAIV